MATAAASCFSSALRRLRLVSSLGCWSWPAWLLRSSPWLVHAFLLYSLLALGDLLHHVWRIEAAVRAGDLPRARLAVSALVGRDTDRMDGGACRRAAVESLSENLTDGFVSPVFWYVLAGLPGTRAVQGRQHDGFDGRLQDAALSPLRLVRREARRRDELPAGPDDVAGHRGVRRSAARVLGPQGVDRRPSPAPAVAGTELRLERSRDSRSARAADRRSRSGSRACR